MKTTTTAFWPAIMLTYLAWLLTLSTVSAQNTSRQTTGNTLCLITRYDVKQNYSKNMRYALLNYTASALTNKNNIMAEVYYEESDSLVLWLIERWNGKSSYDNYARSKAFNNLQLLAKSALVKPAQQIFVNDLEPLSKTQWRRDAAKADTSLTIMLFVDAKAGTENNFKQVYHKAMPQFRSEPGVINYQLSQLAEDSTGFVTYEKFRNEGAFQFHLNYPPIQPVIDYLNTSIKKQPFKTGLHRLIALRPGRQ